MITKAPGQPANPNSDLIARIRDFIAANPDTFISTTPHCRLEAMPREDLQSLLADLNELAA